MKIKDLRPGDEVYELISERERKERRVSVIGVGYTVASIDQKYITFESHDERLRDGFRLKLNNYGEHTLPCEYHHDPAAVIYATMDDVAEERRYALAYDALVDEIAGLVRKIESTTREQRPPASAIEALNFAIHSVIQRFNT